MVAHCESAWEFKATPHNGARRFGARFWRKRKYGKCGNTGCIPHFSYCTIGAKDPPKPAVLIVRCCLNMKIIKRRVSMIFHSENYGCQIGTGACRHLCPVQIHPGGFSAALENKILCGLYPQEFGASAAAHIPQTGPGNLIPSFCQKMDQSIFSTGSTCNHLRMLPIFSFFCVVKHHRW